MPGQTDNPDLLAAVNQVIVVLNEISGQLPELANKCCSCGSADVPTIFIDPVPATPPTGETPPAGIDSWQAYLDYKCNVAKEF